MKLFALRAHGGRIGQYCSQWRRRLGTTAMTGGQRFSPLTAINRANVKSLKVAWTFRTGDAYAPPSGSKRLKLKRRLFMWMGRSLSVLRLAASWRSPHRQTALAYDPHIARERGMAILPIEASPRELPLANEGSSSRRSTRG